MRLEIYNHLSSSALTILKKLQEVVEDPSLKQTQTTHAAGVHPNLGGCVDSPEASTLILMLVGTIGIYYGSALFLKLRRRKTVAAV